MWLIPLSLGVQPCEAYGNKYTVTASTGSLLRPPTFQIQQPPAPTPAVARTGFNACETRETPVCSTLLPQTGVSSSALVDHLQYYQQNPDSLFLLAESAGYSLASYYTSLGLFVISVPGLWSLIKRSVKSKIVQKTFIGEGAEKKAPNRVAGEILSFFTRNNFVVTNRGETITFEGMMVPSRGQAALLTFCTCISLASVALVLTITVPDVGNNWFWITVLSPLA